MPFVTLLFSNDVEVSKGYEGIYCPAVDLKRVLALVGHWSVEGVLRVLMMTSVMLSLATLLLCCHFLLNFRL